MEWERKERKRRERKKGRREQVREGEGVPGINKMSPAQHVMRGPRKSNMIPEGAE